MTDAINEIKLLYTGNSKGILRNESKDPSNTAWSRIKLYILSNTSDVKITEHEIILSWPEALNVIREFGSKSVQTQFNFRFKPEGEAKEKLKAFIQQIKNARSFRHAVPELKSEVQIESDLIDAGFTERELKPFQIRDLRLLLALSNGANFSVPGAGKTTVTFALHILTKQPGQHLLVIAPKAAFQAWKDIVHETMSPSAPNNGAEPFTLLTGKLEETKRLLESGATRFLISYDLMVRQQEVLEEHFLNTPTHIVLDEAHRMKAGLNSQRGAFLLNTATLPVRRDILTGTPMPQAASDIESLLDFLWPGHGYGFEITQGKAPRDVLGNLYVRTTKTELNLPKANRYFPEVTMEPGQLALYSIVRNELLRQFSKTINKGMGEAQFLKARKSVMRLLQLSVNPALAISAMADDELEIDSGIIDQVIEEGHSSKLKAVMNHARDLANEGKKVVIWTIFTGTIQSLEAALADLNPVVLYGGVPSGDESDISTREGRIRKFHEDDSCKVLIANPAAAGEGISLHTVCHNAIYADRSYVSTHYLQSIDRIHRLGLPEGTETNIFVYRTKAPPEIGSIDLSVSRRLTEKVRNMQMLLDDPDLHEIAFDEEEADDPIDYDVTMQDIIDLISELEGKAPPLDMDEE